MHTTFAVSTTGLPLGILDQNIYARKKSGVEEKESKRWLESLKNTSKEGKDNRVVTVCDREADIYDFFELAYKINQPVLIRAAQNRNVNKGTREKQKLWEAVEEMKCAGTLNVEVPARNNQEKRVAKLEVKFGGFTMNAPKALKKEPKEIEDIELQAIYIVEKEVPRGAERLEWVLITNLKVDNFEEAREKISWYSLRWRIEVFHKILKSGLKVEDCRLSEKERLVRYLTVMSIIAWRIFFTTIIARTEENLSCNVILEEEEWKVLYAKEKEKFPDIGIEPPSVREAVIWIAKLGGYLARKRDPAPGPIVLWRGWKRLFDLVDGWKMAHICG